MEWNRPDRHDYYLMRISQRVQQVLSKKPNSIKLEQQKVEFETKTEKKPRKKKLTASQKSQVTALAKSKWVGAVMSLTDKGKDDGQGKGTGKASRKDSRRQ